MLYDAAMPRRSAKTRVAIAVTDQSNFEGDIVRGAIDYSHHGDRWQMARAEGRPFLRFEQIDLGDVDGVIAGFYDARWVDAIERAGVAAVNTAAVLPGLSLPYVGNDETATGTMGAEYLLGRGFARLAFIEQGVTEYSQLRHAAFRRLVHDEAGRPCHSFRASFEKTERDQSRLRRWLAELPTPIGIMAANDFLGMQAINAAAQLHRRVPDDVAVLGVDNDVWCIAQAHVPMSSIALDFQQVGYRAAALLDSLMAGQTGTPPQQVRPVGVVTRRSTDITMADDAVVTAALAFIRDHLADDINVEDVLDHVGLSRKMLEIRMKRAVGQTPHAAITRARVEQAKKLLVGSDQTIEQIARATGFRRATRLIEAFKRHAGVTPGQYRQQQAR